MLGSLQPQALEFLIYVDPSDSASNYYVDAGVTLPSYIMRKRQCYNYNDTLHLRYEVKDCGYVHTNKVSKRENGTSSCAV